MKYYEFFPPNLKNKEENNAEYYSENYTAHNIKKEGL